ncbi:MAG: 23S rRNA (pseudouridine(1915)-N(3))-methyltransferase RlmH [Saprospirales bacterium]|nr:23S rRNA (pseudouridine(1915)-N(3))-methyltransferase RlmH [Saprospirales bacterium]MBK8492281.1 23S rRNA (pseudouridine(1915)-N(3))-methyltransferase RlmH [Saprospirales bacterium]
MKVELWQIGKTAFPYLEEGIRIYEGRLLRYLPFQIETLPDVKNAQKLPGEQLKVKEGEIVLSRLKTEDYLVLLDERGKMYNSVEWAQLMERELMLSHKRIIFLIGGAYGFSPTIYARANSTLSLSKMTFSHQMIRLFFLEQLYRAMTILRNEPYHNEG